MTQDTETLKRVDIYKSVGYISQHHPSSFFRKRGEGPLYLCPFAPPPYHPRHTSTPPLLFSHSVSCLPPTERKRERERDLYTHSPNLSVASPLCHNPRQSGNKLVQHATTINNPPRFVRQWMLPQVQCDDTYYLLTAVKNPNTRRWGKRGDYS